MDGSAIVTGLLLALVLPPMLPLWMVAVGSVFSIAIVKEAWAGRKIAQIARRYRVYKDSVYTWMQTATQACLHALSPKSVAPNSKSS